MLTDAQLAEIDQAKKEFPPKIPPHLVKPWECWHCTYFHGRPAEYGLVVCVVCSNPRFN